MIHDWDNVLCEWNECVIAYIVVWENPNPNTKCVTQLGTTINVTLIDVPLILVKDKSNTSEDS
jgi:hypothetical protein